MASLKKRVRGFVAEFMAFGDRRWGKSADDKGLAKVTAIPSQPDGGIPGDTEAMFYLTADDAESGTSDPQEVNAAETVSIIGDLVNIKTRLETPNTVRVEYIGAAGVTDHGALTGLGDDDHTQYALLAGRAGGQTLIGGTGAGDDLTLNSTTHATKGDVRVNYADADNHLLLCHGDGKVASSSFITGLKETGLLEAFGVNANGSFSIGRNAAGSHALINGNSIAIRINNGGDDTNTVIEGSSDPILVNVDAGLDMVGIGVATPSEKLSVEGAIALDEIGAISSTAGYGKIYVSTDTRIYLVGSDSTVHELTPIFKQVFWCAQDLHLSGTCNLPCAVDPGQGALMGVATYTNNVTFDATKGLTDAFGRWEWDVQTDPFYATAKISVGAPFRWYTGGGATGSTARCKTARVGVRCAVNNNAYFDSVKIKLTDGTNTSSTTITPTSTMTDYWTAAIDISGWANVTNLRASIVFDGDDGEAALTHVSCDLEYIQVELWAK